MASTNPDDSALPRDPSGDRRQEDRRQVRLEVRFDGAREFEVQFAHNLSQGGLFVAGAEQLKPMEEVALTVSLPGHDCFQVRCMVAHVVTDTDALLNGKTAGAGLAILDRPPGFEEALQDYLDLIQGRKEARLFVSGLPQEFELLREAGYLVCDAPAPDHLLDMIGPSRRVLALLIRESETEPYREVLRQAGLPDLVIPVGADEPYERLLNRVDRMVLARMSSGQQLEHDQTVFNMPVIKI